MNRKINNNYSRALNLTETLLDTSLDSRLSGPEAQWRWSALAQLWEDNIARLGGKVFYAAVHHLFWGVYPDAVTSPELQELVAIVEEELLADGPAYRAWKSRQAYRLSFRMIVNSASPSEREDGPSLNSRSTGRYLNARLYYRVVYKEQDPPDVNLAIADNWAIRSAQKRARDTANARGYEAVVKRLIPKAANWSYAEWSDDRILFREIRKRYGVNFMKDSRDFDAIIDYLVDLWVHGVEHTLGRVISIKNMPTAMIEALWPDKTVEQIAKMFLDARSRVNSVEHRERRDRNGKILTHPTRFSTQNLKSSWLYKQVMAWINDGTLSGPAFESVRAAVFDLNMGI